MAGSSQLDPRGAEIKAMPSHLGFASFAVAPTALAVSLLAVACGPNTDLIGEGVGSPASAGGQNGGMASVAALVNPSAGTADVPVNLAAVTVRFPVAVTVPDGALTVSGGGQTAAVGVPVIADCPDGGTATCFQMSLSETLLPAATYVVAIGGGVVGGDGRALPAGPVGQFITAAKADLTAPAIIDLGIQPSGPCILVSFQTDEPAAATLVIRSASAERDVAAGAGVVQFSVAVSLAAFGAGSDVEILARARDLAGNVSESAVVSLTVPATLLPLAITEIHANPAGPEPMQEYVEIRNLGSTPVDFGSVSIEDSKGSDTLPAGTLAAGAYALIVPVGFDPASPVDTRPLAGTPLVHVDTRIGSDGLANTGEAVRLRATDGTILSSYTAVVDVSASKWSGKSVHRIPEDACDQAATWTRLPGAATPGWGPP